MSYTETRELREQLREAETRLAARIDETNKRIDTVYRELPRKIEETNRRIDRLYELQAARKEKETNKP